MKKFIKSTLVSMIQASVKASRNEKKECLGLVEDLADLAIDGNICKKEVSALVFNTNINSKAGKDLVVQLVRAATAVNDPQDKIEELHAQLCDAAVEWLDAEEIELSDSEDKWVDRLITQQRLNSEYLSVLMGLTDLQDLQEKLFSKIAEKFDIEEEEEVKPKPKTKAKSKTKAAKAKKVDLDDDLDDEEESTIFKMFKKLTDKLEHIIDSHDEVEVETKSSKSRKSSKSSKSRKSRNLTWDIEEDVKPKSKSKSRSIDWDDEDEDEEEDSLIGYNKRMKNTMIEEIMGRDEKRTTAKRGAFHRKPQPSGRMFGFGSFKGYAAELDMNADEEALVAFVCNNLDTPIDNRKVAKFERMLCAYLDQNFDSGIAQDCLSWFGDTGGANFRRARLHNMFELDELSETGIGHLWSFINKKPTLLRKVKWSLSDQADRKAKLLVKAYTK